MADIKKELNDIKNAVYGREVRSSIHDGIKKINDESEESKRKAEEAHEITQDLLDETFDSAVLEANFEQRLNDEIANLQPEWTQFTNDTVSQLAQTEKVVYVEQFKEFAIPLEDGLYDWTPAFIEAKKYLSENGKLVAPKSDYVLTDKIVFNGGNFEIDFNNSVFIWRGSGYDSTYEGIFQFNGELTDVKTHVMVDEPEKTNTITVLDPSLFEVGDYILIRTPDGSPATDPKDVYNRYLQK